MRSIAYQIEQIPPLGITQLDQIDFPIGPPLLRPLLANDGIFDAVMGFGEDQERAIVFGAEA